MRDDKQISDKNRAAIKDAIAAGITVIIASGRSLGALPPAVTGIPGIEYAVTSNGAAIYRMKDRACLHRVRIRAEAVDQILQMTEGMRLGMETFLNGFLTPPGSIWRIRSALAPCPMRFLTIRAPGSRWKTSGTLSDRTGRNWTGWT